MRHCALIPAYNEAEHIARVVKGCLAHCPRVLVVDDASEDDTAVQAAEAGAVVLRHATNAGKGAALDTGFQYLKNTEVQGVVMLDGNGRHAPQDLPRFFKRAEKGDVDVIIGCGMHNVRHMPLLRQLVNRAASRFVSVLSGHLVHDSQSGFRWIRKDVWDDAGVLDRSCNAETQFLINAGQQGFRITEVPLSARTPSNHGEVHPLWDMLRFLCLSAKHIF
ncbi:MAG: glycosyltransferase family 2 protein [Planctomycetes bacterium]|nr:glycosyltransferase family 2 protein [Planctomycetota bacterium]